MVMSGAELTMGEWAASVAALPRPILLAFDVDGTLSPIVERSDSARIPAEVQRNLRYLSTLPAVRLAVITGRDLGALRRMLPFAELYRAIEHGAVVLSPGELARPLPPRGAQGERLQAFADWVERQAVPAGGVLESKRASRALHVRALSRHEPERALALLREAKSVALALGLQPREGRSVLEAELVPGDKGRALRRIRRLTAARGVFFAGDDYTDEPAIACAVEDGGIGLFVASEERPQPPPKATGSLAGPQEVAELVARLRSAFKRPRRLRRGQGGSSRRRPAQARRSVL